VQREDGNLSRLRWLLVSRLVIFLLISGAIFFFLRRENVLYPLLALYGLGTLVYLFALRRGRITECDTPYPAFLSFQLFFEVLLEGGIVHYSGGMASPFILLFVFSIISGSILFGLKGGVLVATWASILYELIIWLERKGILLTPAGSISFPADKIFLALYLHVCFFFLAAFLSGFLAERLKERAEELQSASSQLRKARLETDDILQHMRSGLITLDRNGEIVYFNHTAEEILGRKREEMVGKVFKEVITPQSPELGELIRQSLYSGEGESRGELLIKGEKRDIPVGINTSILSDNQEGVRGVIAVFQDLTEVKKLEERMRRADRLAAVGQLSANVAHEIRNPLSSIRGSVEVLKSELNLEGEEGRLMDLIIKESDRLNGVLKDFLSFARPGKGRFKILNLRGLVEEVAVLLRKEPVKLQGRSIEVNLGERPLLVRGDEDQLKQVLLNLGLNGLEALDRVGWVRFEALGSEDGKVGLAVSDNGRGIPPSVREKIFQPFFSTKKGGTGLGLSIAERIVEEHGGQIEVRSQKGRGTTFLLTLKGRGYVRG